MKQTLISEHVHVSPIMIRGNVESTPYALRLTPLGRYGDFQIKDFLKQFEYVYVNEKSKKGKEHSHIVLFTKDDEDVLRQKIRDFLKIYFPDPAKRGDANKQYNLSEVEDVELAITYILKDSEEVFMSEGIIKEKIDELKKQSYKKFSKEDFAKQLEELKKQFKANDPNLDEMMVSVIRLKALYRQPINMTYIYQMCLSFFLHNRPSRIESNVQEFLSRRL